MIFYSEREISVVDNGNGISDDQFSKLLDLGAGSKLETHESELKRSYLGSFGFGIKSIINISREMKVDTVNKNNRLSTNIDIATVHTHGFKIDWEGFDIDSKKKLRKDASGTSLKLSLRNDLTPDSINAIRTSLYNLPKSVDFSVCFLPKKDFAESHLSQFDLITNLEIPKKYEKFLIKGTLEIGNPKSQTVPILGSDSIKIDVWCNGLDDKNKVKSLNQFAGVYIKVDGRVLKRNFQGEKVLDGISKHPKFRHGMRIEIPIDWISSQISLGRDGIQFLNDSSKNKFEAELKMAVTAAVKPYAQQLENRKKKKFDKELDARLRRAKDRISRKHSIIELEKTGFSFIPADDYEMVLMIANPTVLKKICPDWMLMDFNGQLDFDCLVYNKKNTNYYRIELEPKLDSFLSQGISMNTDYIITWSLGSFKIGKSKKGFGGIYELTECANNEAHYKLLIKTSEKSKEPKQCILVFCIDRIVSKMKK